MAGVTSESQGCNSLDPPLIQEICTECQLCPRLCGPSAPSVNKDSCPLDIYMPVEGDGQ